MEIWKSCLIFGPILILSGCIPYLEPKDDSVVLRYNYMDNNWQYAPYNSNLKYNYMEKRYEYSR